MPKGAENPEKLVVQRRRYACVYKCIAEANVTFRERGEQARRCDTVFLKGKTMSYRAWHDEGSDKDVIQKRQCRGYIGAGAAEAGELRV